MTPLQLARALMALQQGDTGAQLRLVADYTNHPEGEWVSHPTDPLIPDCWLCLCEGTSSYQDATTEDCAECGLERP